tara:strand:+ start:2133 stop:2378 length:246 start_codon:yes stop_codon:yes gene_type:complete
MPRPTSAKNRYYHFEISVDNTEPILLRTMLCVASHLGVGRATIQRKLKNPELILNKYKNKNLIIKRIKLPIYERADIEINY